MNLGPEIVSGSYKYLLVQSGSNPITLGANASVNWNAGGVVATTGAQSINGVKTFSSNVKAVSFGSLLRLSAWSFMGLIYRTNRTIAGAKVQHYLWLIRYILTRNAVASKQS